MELLGIARQAWRMTWRHKPLWIFGLFALVLGVALLHALAWIPASVRGRLAGGGLGLRLWPFLAALACAWLGAHGWLALRIWEA